MLDIKDFLTALGASVKQFPDRGAKWLLENTENLRGLLEIIASDIVEHLDFGQVEIKNTTFIPDNLRQQESDLVYLLPFRDTVNTGGSARDSASEVMIYILVEHQSTVDPTMGFRLLFYMCQIWDSQRREYMAKNLPQREWRFQPIIPIVFYTGEQKWEVFPSLATLMDLPAVFNRFIPSFDVLLLDVRHASDETLLKSDHPFGWLLTVLKQETADTEVFVGALARFGDHLQSRPDSERASWKQAIYYLYLFIFYRRSIDEWPALEQIVSENHEFLELSEEEAQLMQSMAEHYLQQGIEQGIEQGETRTKREDILKLLQLRFHRVPEPLAEKIRILDNRDQLEVLFEKVATSDTLEELHSVVDASAEDKNYPKRSE